MPSDAPGTRACVALDVTLVVGSRWARVSRRLARAWRRFAAATRRSVLAASASPTSRSITGVSNSFHQSAGGSSATKPGALAWLRSPWAGALGAGET